MKSMVLVFAHPGEESCFSGLVISKYIENGWNVHVLIAASEQVHRGKYFNPERDDVATSERRELEQATKILGATSLTLLGYKEGKLKDYTDGELEDKIYKKMVDLGPDIVITCDPSGVTNNSDNIRISYATTYSFQRYTQELLDTRQFVVDVNVKKPGVKIRNFTVHHKYALKQKSFAESVSSHGIPKLYYACLPESVVRHLIRNKVIQPVANGKLMVGVEDKFITSVIDGKKYSTKKQKALASYISQKDSYLPYLSLSSNPALYQEYYILRMQGVTEIYMGKNERVSDRLSS